MIANVLKRSCKPGDSGESGAGCAVHPCSAHVNLQKKRRGADTSSYKS